MILRLYNRHCWYYIDATNGSYFSVVREYFVVELDLICSIIYNQIFTDKQTYFAVVSSVCCEDRGDSYCNYCSIFNQRWLPWKHWKVNVCQDHLISDIKHWSWHSWRWSWDSWSWSVALTTRLLVLVNITAGNSAYVLFCSGCIKTKNLI